MEQQGVRQRRTPPATLGPMLGRARLRTGLRSAEAARLVGISRQYLVRLESGQRCPSVGVAEALAEVLRLDKEDRAELMAAAVTRGGMARAVGVVGSGGGSPS